jgi:hypothetical protein
MVCHMKTTVELPDALLEAAKQVAREEGTTLRALLEVGLRAELDRRRGQHVFRLRDASFRGKGLQPEVADGSWERIRDTVYEGRGAP